MQFFPWWNLYGAVFAICVGKLALEAVFDSKTSDEDIRDSEFTILELAQQGDIEAIQTILNRILKPYNISNVNVKHKGDCLQISLESYDKVPNQQSLVLLLKDEIVKLDIQSINKIKVSGRISRERFIDWKQYAWVRPVIVKCENCGAKNRIPLSDNREPICGKCKHPLENSSVFSI